MKKRFSQATLRKDLSDSIPSLSRCGSEVGFGEVGGESRGGRSLGGISRQEKNTRTRVQAHSTRLFRHLHVATRFS